MKNYLGGCSGFATSQMKRLLFLSLLLCSCGGSSSYLSRAELTAQKSRALYYYDTVRSNGQSFRGEFYTGSDSISLHVPKSDNGVSKIYDTIRALRFTDSADSHTRSFFKHVATNIGLYFDQATAGRD